MRRNLSTSYKGRLNASSYALIAPLQFYPRRFTFHRMISLGHHEASGQSPGTSEPSRNPSEEVLRWSTFPSWKYFVWLYMFSAMAGIRGLLLLQSGTSGGEVWLGGAALLLACVTALRRWAQYFLTSRRVIVKNGYTGLEIQALPLDQIAGILIEQGPVARILNIGTVVLRTYTGDESITLRGVSEPEILRTRVDALTTHRADHRTGHFISTTVTRRLLKPSTQDLRLSSPLTRRGTDCNLTRC